MSEELASGPAFIDLALLPTSRQVWRPASVLGRLRRPTAGGREVGIASRLGLSVPGS